MQEKSSFRLALCVLSLALPIALAAQQEVAVSFSSNGEMGVYSSWNSTWMLDTAGTGTFLFTAKATNDIHIAVSDSAATADTMYEIVIGGWGNSSSAIRRASQGEVLVQTEKSIKDPGAESDFWVSLDAKAKTLSVGYGSKVGEDVIFSWMDPDFLAQSRFFALSSWDSPIEYSKVAVIHS